MNKLSPETLNKLSDVLSNIENEIGHACQIKIIQLDDYDNNSYLMSTMSFDNTSLVVYDAINEYKELECVIDICENYYKAIIKLLDMLHKKYNEERFSSIEDYICDKGYNEGIGICRKCNKYKTNDYSMNSPHVRVGPLYDQCQSCGLSWVTCKYYSLTLDYTNLLILKNKNQEIAKFKLIRNLNNKSSLLIDIPIIDVDSLTIII